MKRLVLIGALILCRTILFAQTDSITTRNIVDFTYKIKKNLIPEYEKVLNFISDKITSVNEVEDLINNKVKGPRETRVFTDSKVVIENDLIPGSDTSKLLTSDMDVIRYLNNFNTSYVKTDDKSISLNILEISPLKFTTYYFYNVKLECEYLSSYSTGEKYNKFLRIAEVKILNDSGWHLYINGVSFPKGNEMDSTNYFTGVYKSETDVDRLMEMFDSEDKKRIREEKNKIAVLIEQGEEKYENGDFEGALKKYREAKLINLYDKEVQDKIARVKVAIEKKKQKEREEAERKKHMEEMNVEVYRQRSNYNFRVAQILCDSLLQDYQSKDTGLVSLNAELSVINSYLAGIESAMGHKDIKEAVANCNSKIKEVEKTSKNKLYLAELYYRMALAYYTLDRSEKSRIFESLNEAILRSDKHHQEALRMRVDMYLSSGEAADVTKAVEDATQVISNDLRNPDNYALRAKVYEKDKNPKAIEDYSKAILYQTTDRNVFLNKAILEYNGNKYRDAITTTSDGITKMGCYGMLYYYRGISKDKTGELKEAGDDFRKALKCGIGQSERTQIKFISDGYLAAGNGSFVMSNYKAAIKDFTKSVLIDSSSSALYWRARCYINTGVDESAVEDLSALLGLVEMKDALNQRGIAYTNLKKFDEANTDFNAELTRYPEHALAHYAKGISLMAQKNYSAAAASFEKAATLQASDSAWYQASLANFNIKNYSKAIEQSNNARKNGTKKFEIYYIGGRSFYENMNYSEAIKEFEKAKKLVNYDDNLYFWHAAALEKNKDFLAASQAYDQLTGSQIYKDTCIYRSAICLVNSREETAYTQAINKFLRYNLLDKNTDKSEPHAWTAYAYLNTGALDKAGSCMETAKKSNEQLPMVLYVDACIKVKESKYEDAIINLEKAVPGLRWQKKDYDNDPLIRELKKNPVTKARYALLMEKVSK